MREQSNPPPVPMNNVQIDAVCDALMGTLESMIIAHGTNIRGNTMMGDWRVYYAALVQLLVHFCKKINKDSGEKLLRLRDVQDVIEAGWTGHIPTRLLEDS